MISYRVVRCQWPNCGVEFETTTQSHARYCPAHRKARHAETHKLWAENHKPQCKLRHKRHYRLECIRRVIEKYTVEELQSILRRKQAKERKV